MPIIVHCKECGKKNNAPDNAAGKRGKCPACGAVMEIPVKHEAPIIELSAEPEVSASKPAPTLAPAEILNSKIDWTLPPKQLQLAIGLLFIALVCGILPMKPGGPMTFIGMIAAPVAIVILLGGFPKITGLVRYGGGIIAGLFAFSILVGMFTDPKPSTTPSQPIATTPTQVTPIPSTPAPLSKENYPVIETPKPTEKPVEKLRTPVVAPPPPITILEPAVDKVSEDNDKVSIAAARMVIEDHPDPPAPIKWGDTAIARKAHPHYLIHVKLDAHNKNGALTRMAYVVHIELLGGTKFNQSAIPFYNVPTSLSPDASADLYCNTVDTKLKEIFAKK
jgi:hypothetical protein